MCGPLSLNFAGKKSSLACYNAGRLLGYVGLGVVAGIVGENAIELVAPTAWLSSASLLIIGLTLIFMGTTSLNGRRFHFRLPSRLEKLITIIWNRLRLSKMPPLTVSFLAGAFTIFLPCGHLYGFVAGALAMRSPVGGAIFMAAFWAGTVPSLAFGAKLVARLLHLPFASGTRWPAAIMLLAGLVSLVGFAHRISRFEHASHSQSGSVMHVSDQSLESRQVLPTSCH